MGDTRCKHCGERIIKVHRGETMWVHVTGTDRRCHSVATPEEARRG